MLHKNPRTALYMRGIQTAVQFCELNEIPVPVFMTYTEALDAAGVNVRAHRLWPFKFLQRVVSGQPNLVGAGTGLYKDNHIFVNLPVTALPVQVPGNRRYSWPGWKTDRTACGVVAHEMGHHLENHIACGDSKTIKRFGEQWRQLIQNSGKKPVSGYEPVPSEAFAETLRLFILNPDLLMRAIPMRYQWLIEELNLAPLPKLLKQGWCKVLNNPAYDALAERWIA